MNKGRAGLGLSILWVCLAASSLAAAENHPVVNGVDTSKWRGFNLLEKFTLAGDSRYREEEFALMKEWGFTFVRLPIDYRCYTAAADWLAFDENKLREIDQAVEYGRACGIHVCLALHRAPGYCINPPAEARDLWADPDAQKAFIAHWKMFAARYRSVPAEALSFNLLNEPNEVSAERCLDLFSRTIDAIRAIDGTRIVVVDGIDGGAKPLKGLLGRSGIVEATRGYHPFGISHYRAEWVAGSQDRPLPQWPPLPTIPAFLYGPQKTEYRRELVVSGDFPAGTKISVLVGTVSVRSRLLVRAGDETVIDASFSAGPGAGEWKESEYRAEWNIYQALYDRVCSGSLAAPAKSLLISNESGDWMTMGNLAIDRPDGRKTLLLANDEWGRRQEPIALDSEGKVLRPAGYRPRDELEAFLAPWDEYMDSGGTVFVGESGAYNKTPQPVVLAWFREWLDIWKERRMGWALWNFRGSFGIIDSGRSDVAYESFRGHLLDRKMLELLREY
jgi:hypothetical protein